MITKLHIFFLAGAIGLIPAFASTDVTHTITVNSQFGGTEVSPVAGVTTLTVDSTVDTVINFTAPEYVYLDRFMNELGADASEITNFSERVFYRARSVGYAIRLGKTDAAFSSSDHSFSQVLDDDVSVVWNWVLDFAGSIDLGTSSLDGLSDADASDIPAGLDWYGTTDLVPNLGTSFESTVNAAVGAAGTSSRFATKGYILENGPNPAERSVVFSGQEAYLGDG